MNVIAIHVKKKKAKHEVKSKTNQNMKQIIKKIKNEYI